MKKITTAWRVLKQSGVGGVWWVIRHKVRHASWRSSRYKWKIGVRSEINYWDHWFQENLDSLRETLPGADAPLLPQVSELLPDCPNVKILDVGAGPITALIGTPPVGKHVEVTAVDPLAKAYDQLLTKYGVDPPIRTRELAAEDLRKAFDPDTFDLAYARNCIDHAYDPEQAIMAMVALVKPGGTVLLEHMPNEAEAEGYSGLHQWNFAISADGDFLIGSRHRTVNMTRKYADVCTMESDIEPNWRFRRDWLFTRIRKPAEGDDEGNR